MPWQSVWTHNLIYTFAVCLARSLALYCLDKQFQLVQSKYFPHDLEIDAFINKLIGQMDI